MSPFLRWTPFFVLLAMTVRAQTPPTDGARKGYFQTRFSERSPLGEIEVQARRFHWQLSWLEKQDPKKGRYSAEDASYWVLVPSAYDPNTPHGLLVWISPGPTGQIPSAWVSVLETRNLICVGADASGNDREIWYRVAFALDAAHNLKKTYNIEERRIYVCGHSGGGRVASRVGLHYPDVFQGGLYMGGCNFYRDLKSTDGAGRVWPARFPRPVGKLAELAKKRSRHVLFVGAQDFNRAHAHAVYEALRRDGHRHLAWLEQPDMGHVCAEGRWLDQAIEALDTLSKVK